MTPKTARTSWLAGPLVALARKNFQVRFKRSYFGLAWLVVQPTTQALVLSLIFTRVFKVTQVPNYLVYVLSGIVPWSLTLQAVNGATSSIVDNASLVKKIAVPRLIFPFATVLGSLMAYVAPLSVLLLVAGFSGTLGLHTLMLPLALLLHIALVVPIGVFLCCFFVAYRDIRYVMDALFLLLFYATPILFPLERVPDAGRAWVQANPMAGVLDVYRFSAMGREIELRSVAVTLGCTVVASLAAAWAWRGRSDLFADQL